MSTYMLPVAFACKSFYLITTVVYRPMTSHLLSEHEAPWHTWNIKNGQTDTIRTHLRIRHYDDWAASVVQNRLKGWETLGFKNGIPPTTPSYTDRPEPFSLEGLERRIVQFISRGDHVSCVLEFNHHRIYSRL